jgi:hypothetical protein
VLQQRPKVWGQHLPGALLVLLHIHGGRVLAHEEAIGGDAQGIEVIGGGGRVVAVAMTGQADVEQAGLRREVGRSAGRKRLPGEALGALEVSGAEVDEHREAVRQLYKYVVALDVAVHGPSGMQGFQGASQVSQHPAQLLA